MATRLQELLRDQPLAYIDFLNQMSYDELVELDLRANRSRNLAHVAGKYYVPLRDSDYDELHRHAVELMVHPDDRERYCALMDPALLPGRLAAADPPGVETIELRYKLINGGWSWARLIVLGGERFGLPKDILHIYIFDIHNKKTRDQGLMAASASVDTRDGRTRLLRERPFLAEAQKRIDSGLTGDWCILTIDIEHFRLFNDWYGRSSGDILLAEVGAALSSCETERGGLAGYLGQDDFCMMMPYSEDAVQNLSTQLQTLIASHGPSLGFLPAIGVRVFRGEYPVHDLLDDAALALAAVKNNYGHRIVVFRPEMRTQREEDYRILLDFQRALNNGELFFYLQPLCRISSRKIVGAECLARWRRADGSFVPPDRFIPVLERHGFITDLDKFIWEQVCIWMHGWIEAGHQPVPVSVNVSNVDLFNIDVPDYLHALMERYAIPTGMLKVEITESAYASATDEVEQTVTRLHALGIPVLMDDFGSGYSSLNMLRDISVDAIKLDARFLRMNNADRVKGIHILESIINMSKTMTIPVIMEGVETAEQCSFLSGLGCRYIQGYYFCRPIPVREMEMLITDEANLDLNGIMCKANEELHVREFLDENIYNDTMLNNILGAVAFYSRRGGSVDIVRFNERFYRLVGAPDFVERLNQIENFIYPDDRERFFSLLDHAEEDRLNGANGVVGVYRSDGTLGQFLLRIYYLGDDERGKRYYSSLQDVTQVTQLQSQIRLFARVTSNTVVFLSIHGGSYCFRVPVYGLHDALGMEQETLEKELNSGAFMRRVVEEDRDALRSLSLRSAEAGETFRYHFRIVNDRGETVPLRMKTDYVHDEQSDVEYIILFQHDVD